MSGKIPFKEAVAAWAQQRERPAGRHPSLPELLSYHARRMDEDAKDKMRQHIADCRSCSQTLLEFARLEGENRESPLVTPEELDASWAKMQKRLEAVQGSIPSPPGILGSGKAVDDAKAAKTDINKKSLIRIFLQMAWPYRTKALALIVLFLLPSVIYFSLKSARLSEPQVIGQTHDYSTQRGLTRSAEPAPAWQIRRGEDASLLILGYRGERQFPNYAIEVLDPAKTRPLWASRPLPEPEGLEFIVVLPSAWQTPGSSYRLRLYGLEDDSRELLLEQEIQIE